MVLINSLRTYSYLARVFKSQQQDPYCRACKALVNSVVAAREGLACLVAEQADELRLLPPEFGQLLAEARSVLDGLSLPENAAGQKKAGNCKMPEGVCFVKSSLAILKKL